MNARFITYVIIGVAFGFTQLWFVYWVVRLFKEKQRLLAVRRAQKQDAARGQRRTSGQAAAPAGPARGEPGGGAGPG